jgi:hypothetical protein
MISSYLIFGVTITLPGQTEAGSAGRQPCRGITWWAHRDDAWSVEVTLLRSFENRIGSVDSDALEIPARRAESTTTVNARLPFHAEPEQERSRLSTSCAYLHSGSHIPSGELLFLRLATNFVSSYVTPSFQHRNKIRCHLNARARSATWWRLPLARSWS